jgi:hypothetical protein
MSKLKDKTEVGSFFGEAVTVTKVNNRLVVKNRPKRNGKKRVLTENEIAQQDHFKQAARYASFVQNNEELNVLYAARKRSKYESAYTVALADFHNAPKISDLIVNKEETDDKDEIQVNASDDFMVMRVSVEIFAADGSLIERGNATQNTEKYIDCWFYIPAVAQPTQPGMKIIATAYDRPGNKTAREIVL